jgi:hypothetical protein
MEANDCLADLFTFPNFVPQSHCTISLDDMRVTIPLNEEDRPQKVSAGDVVRNRRRSMTTGRVTSVIFQQAVVTSPWWSRCGGSVANAVAL